MDIDNGPQDNQAGNAGIEQSLLQQFSCLGTTDKDELVKQLQRLLGSTLNWETASFFLDMNNWNLQAAVCSYFDIEAPYQLPSMTLVVDYPVGEDGSVPTNTRFKKVWEIQNNGSDRWPTGCVLQHTAGERLGADARIPVACIRPGEVIQVVVEMISPLTPGMYQSKWRMCTDHGCYFGDAIVTIITVTDKDTMQLSQQLSEFHELGRSPPPEMMNNPFATPLSNQILFQDSVQPPSQDSDTHMC